MRDMNAPSGLYGYPAMDWWKEKWDAIPALQLPGEPKPEIPEIKVTGASSPWSLPLPGPTFAEGEFTIEDVWESHSHHSHHSLSHTSEHSDWTSEPKYVQLGEPQDVKMHRLPVHHVHHHVHHVAPNVHQTPVGYGARNQPDTGLKPPGAPGLSNDPGLSGQRLKRVMHVKQAPIYKYAEWCAHWVEKGGRSSEDPSTPRSELTKSEFDVQYGAWRKALVEGPPQRSAPRVLTLTEHVR